MGNRIITFEVFLRFFPLMIMNQLHGLFSEIVN